MNMNRTVRCTVGAVAAGLVLFAAGALAEEPGPDQVRDQIRKLEQKAQDLKMDGKMEDAKAAAGEAAELRNKIARMERERHQESVAADERRRDAMKQKLEQSRAELKELREAGKEEQAAEVQKRINYIESALANPDRRPDGNAGSASQPDRAEIERRLQHMREAAAHLREAGINDIAEKLTQEAGRIQQQLRGGGDERRGAASSGAEIEKMRAELQELRQAVRLLNARLDAVNRERPDAK
jgi:outer membrane murein-binding lipoprotein Lpp